MLRVSIQNPLLNGVTLVLFPGRHLALDGYLTVGMPWIDIAVNDGSECQALKAENVGIRWKLYTTHSQPFNGELPFANWSDAHGSP
jgi:hypothetical protein